ncbi:MAG: hypothetical protein GZ088_12890 [Acidipila sp.]|nr:hypothetical protein [Acidipila sp.]
MKRDKKSKKAEFAAAQYPRLRDFFSAYLHEDFQDEHGSAAGAATAFCTDGSIEEVQATREEWAKLRKSFAARPIPRLREALQKLGGAWRPQDDDEIRGVDEAFAAKR